MTLSPETIAPTAITWCDDMLLGYTPMDHVHEEFVHCVAAVQAASDDRLLQAVQRLQEHLKRHFDDENHWMTEHNFPAKECHINEHAAVQATVSDVLAQMQQGNATNARPLANELAAWFPGHATYLDSALAHWMCKLRLGGKPVVLRRSLGNSDTQP